MMTEQQQRKKRWEQQRREEQRQKDKEKEKERQRLEKNTIINLPKDMIHEIFDKDPKSGLMLAKTNKWFYEILKDKIKKHRQLIRECNVAAICYNESLCKIKFKEESSRYKYDSYFHCVNCFDYISPNLFIHYFFTHAYSNAKETGIMLCNECTFKYFGAELYESYTYLGFY
jgi:hypothetical protein